MNYEPQSTSSASLSHLSQTETRPHPHPFVSLVPIVVLVAMMALTISLFGGDALGGGTQVALLVATASCIVISMWRYKTPWKQFEQGITDTIASAALSLCILLMIGMMSATWMISGIVPTMIYYGVQIMSPTFFLAATCIICAVVSVMTGSSWTTVATIGVALIGIGTALGISEPWSAGAIISGAYFGDKISPLSDTTVLAATVSRVNLFTHIKYMMRTTTPSMVITLIIFIIAGFTFSVDGSVRIDEYTDGLGRTFNISILTFITPVITAIMIARKVPSLITLFTSAILAAVTAVVMQPHVVLQIAGQCDSSLQALVKGAFITLFTSTAVDTGSAAVNDLVSTSGMAGMMDTIWLILCAMTFGGSMVASGMLRSLTMLLITRIRSTFSLSVSTVLTGLMANLLTCDQYISIILTSSMYRDVYSRKGYEPRLLSRTTEDAVTVTSVLVPWNSCGMTQSTVLGVPTLAYLPFCFFNYISPIMSIIVTSLMTPAPAPRKESSSKGPIENEVKSEG